jgi:predicted O-methyltransferase YrrM
MLGISFLPVSFILIQVALILTNNTPVLEIGTFIGFSTLGWASAVGPEGHVTTLEFSPEYAAIARETFIKNGISNAEVIVGDARESLVRSVCTPSHGC